MKGDTLQVHLSLSNVPIACLQSASGHRVSAPRTALFPSAHAVYCHAQPRQRPQPQKCTTTGIYVSIESLHSQQYYNESLILLENAIFVNNKSEMLLFTLGCTQMVWPTQPISSLQSKTHGSFSAKNTLLWRAFSRLMQSSQVCLMPVERVVSHRHALQASPPAARLPAVLRAPSRRRPESSFFILTGSSARCLLPQYLCHSTLKIFQLRNVIGANDTWWDYLDPDPDGLPAIEHFCDFQYNLRRCLPWRRVSRTFRLRSGGREVRVRCWLCVFGRHLCHGHIVSVRRAKSGVLGLPQSV